MSQTIDNQLEKQVLRRNIDEVIPDADMWRQTPHNQLGGRTPDELLGGNVEDRELLRNLVEAIRHGMVS